MEFADLGTFGYMLGIPVAFFVGSMTLIERGGLPGIVGGILLLGLAGVVAWWAWSYFQRPTAPADAVLEQELSDRVNRR